MAALGKTLIIIGGTIIALGIVLMFAHKIPMAGRLPGDIYVEKKNVTFYFPLMTSLILSVIISVVMYFMGRR